MGKYTSTSSILTKIITYRSHKNLVPYVSAEENALRCYRSRIVLGCVSSTAAHGRYAGCRVSVLDWVWLTNVSVGRRSLEIM